MPQRKVVYIGLVFCLASALGLHAQPADPATKHYVVKRTAFPVIVDGVVNESSWKACEPIELQAAREDGKVTQKTVARMMWDEKFLYFSFECEDSHVWSTMTERDQPIYNEEVVEVFIDADGDKDSYLELEVNPLNTLWDGFIIATRNGDKSINGRKGLLAWNSFGIKRAVSVDGTLNDKSDKDSGWSVELALPLEDVVTGAHSPAVAGDRWRVNLYRIDLPGGNGVRGETFAWSAISGRTFHDPDRFGEIEFSDQVLK